MIFIQHSDLIREVDVFISPHYSRLIMNMSYPTDKILGKDGLLAHSLEDFEFRPSQIQMAQLINDCVQRKDFVIIEAGTGTGKTLGYLVPLVQSGKKTVISTGTKNLQEQIFLKDIPLLEKALDFKIR